MSTLKLSGLTSGSSIIKAPDSGSTGVTFTLPASAGTLATTADVPSSITDNGDATAITINSSEQVGIGVTSPDTTLHIKGTNQIAKFETTSATGQNYIRFTGSSGNKGYFGYGGGSNDLLSLFNQENYDMAFGTNDTERMRILAGGDVNISSGNLVIGTNGKGIDFSANADSSATGASTTSELLDDYEEGTWTPVLADASGNAIAGSQSGFYTKIGRAVHFEFNLNVGSHSGTTGGDEAQVNGFPFAAANTIYSPHTTSCGSMASNVGDCVILQIFPLQSYGRFYKDNWNTSSHVSVKIQDFGTSGFVRCSGTYYTT